MSAQVLREAAALMRERAKLALWVDFDGKCDWVGNVATLAPEDADRQHIVGMSPVVALGVADWLDATALEHESDSGNPRVDSFFADFDTAPDHAAVAVARAYLGSP